MLKTHVRHRWVCIMETNASTIFFCVVGVVRESATTSFSLAPDPILFPFCIMAFSTLWGEQRTCPVLHGAYPLIIQMFPVFFSLLSFHPSVTKCTGVSTVICMSKVFDHAFSMMNYVCWRSLLFIGSTVLKVSTI